jgi:hypothetical protein
MKNPLLAVTSKRWLAPGVTVAERGGTLPPYPAVALFLNGFIWAIAPLPLVRTVGSRTSTAASV